jgi:dTDP-4-dehydrorhamnose 3,5-epimerase
MKFQKTPIPGVLLVEPERHVDGRGHFARVWCRDEFGAQGLDASVAQINTGFSHRAGTLRGMHYQAAPHAENKFVRCTRGALYDVALDLRRESPTFKAWFGVELRADDGRMLWIPEGCAHGYQTLADDTELTYLTSTAYEPTSARGVRHDDPAFDIRWPHEVRVISDADREWPAFEG